MLDRVKREETRSSYTRDSGTSRLTEIYYLDRGGMRESTVHAERSVMKLCFHTIRGTNSTFYRT